MWKTAHQHILKLVSYEPGKPVEELAREMGLQPEEIVKLASNENPLGPSPKAVAAMRDASRSRPLLPRRWWLGTAHRHRRKLGLTRKMLFWAMVRMKSSNSSDMRFFGLAMR